MNKKTTNLFLGELGEGRKLIITIFGKNIEEQFSRLTTSELIWIIRESQISLALNLYGRLSDHEVNNLYKRMEVAEQIIIKRVVQESEKVEKMDQLINSVINEN